MKIKEEIEPKLDAEPVASEAPGPSAKDADDQIPATQADPSEDLLDEKVGFFGFIGFIPDTSCLQSKSWNEWVLKNILIQKWSCISINKFKGDYQNQ